MLKMELEQAIKRGLAYAPYADLNGPKQLSKFRRKQKKFADAIRK